VAAQAWLADPIAVALAFLNLNNPSLKGLIALWPPRAFGVENAVFKFLVLI